MITIWPTNRTTTRSHTHTHTCTICAVTCWPAAAWPIKLARLYKTKPTAGTCDIRAVLSFGKIRKGKKKRPKKGKEKYWNPTQFSIKRRSERTLRFSQFFSKCNASSLCSCYSLISVYTYLWQLGRCQRLQSIAEGHTTTTTATTAGSAPARPGWNDKSLSALIIRHVWHTHTHSN